MSKWESSLYKINTYGGRIMTDVYSFFTCCGVVISALILAFAGVAFIMVYDRANKSREQEFQIKLEMAKTSKNNHILNMPYKDLMTVVDVNMMYYVEQAIVESGIHSVSDEEKSVQFNPLLISICTNIEMSLSEDLIKAIEFYVTHDYIKTYIKDSSRLLLLAKIEQRGIKQ